MCFPLLILRHLLQLIFILKLLKQWLLFNSIQRTIPLTALHISTRLPCLRLPLLPPLHPLQYLLPLPLPRHLALLPPLLLHLPPYLLFLLLLPLLGLSKPPPPLRLLPLQPLDHVTVLVALVFGVVVGTAGVVVSRVSEGATLGDGGEGGGGGILSYDRLLIR